MTCYDVALWRWWPALFPGYIAWVEAKSAFAAVECLMRSCGLDRVASASARVPDGSCVIGLSEHGPSRRQNSGYRAIGKNGAEQVNRAILST